MRLYELLLKGARGNCLIRLTQYPPLNIHYNNNKRLQLNLMRFYKLLTYHLEDLHVPLVLRVPQVGNPCFKRLILVLIVYPITKVMIKKSLIYCIRSDLHLNFFQRVKPLPALPNYTLFVNLSFSEIFSIQVGMITTFVPPSS